MRGEGEQVTYLPELLEILGQEGVDSAFWLTFARHNLPHRPHLDMAAYGVVKVLEQAHGSACPGMTWQRKESFHALAAAYTS